MVILEILFKSLGIVALIVIFSAMVTATAQTYFPSKPRNRKCRHV